jgi:NitT/TauT family transport system substrate-binding protein
MLRLIAAFGLIAILILPAAGQERVSVATQRLPANGALFIADARGYFSAEGLDIDMTAYPGEADVAQAVASGAADVGLAGYAPAAFDYAGQGLIKFIAAQVSEQPGIEGADLVVSPLAWANGVHRVEDLPGRSVAFAGPEARFQIAEIARAKKLDFSKLKLQDMGTEENVARALATGKADVALLSLPYAHNLLIASEAQLIGWYSELAGPLQRGALFASTRILERRRVVAEKFVRAYRRGAAEYAAILKVDRQGKRSMTVTTREVATIIARYAYPGRPLGQAAASIEASAMPIAPDAALDLQDLARQLSWYRAQKLVETTADAKDMVDDALAQPH